MYAPLLRSRYDRKIAGVCAGFARAYGWDVNLVRLVLILLVIFGGSGVLAYVICWVVIPEEPVGLPPYPPAPPYAGGQAPYAAGQQSAPPPPPYPGAYPPSRQQDYPPSEQPPTA